MPETIHWSVPQDPTTWRVVGGEPFEIPQAYAHQMEFGPHRRKEGLRILGDFSPRQELRMLDVWADWHIPPGQQLIWIVQLHRTFGLDKRF